MPKAEASDIRRWLGWLALVVAFSIACVFLSNWQFGRRQEAVGAMSRLDTNYNSAPAPLESLEKPWGYHPVNEWRPVTLTGHYLPGNALLVRNRPLNGSSGFLEVVPFQLKSGIIALVERGWVSSDSNYAAPKTFGLPSADEQTVVARIREQEPAFAGTVPLGQIASINVDKFVEAAKIKDRVFGHVYLRMASESKPQGLLTPLSKPNLDEGNHLSYALQWILFAVMAVFALFWAIRKERQARAGIVKVRRKDSDSQFEDGLLS